jgi:hypothetical protein
MSEYYFVRCVLSLFSCCLLLGLGCSVSSCFSCNWIEVMYLSCNLFSFLCIKFVVKINFPFNHFNIQEHDDILIRQALFSIEKVTLTMSLLFFLLFVMCFIIPSESHKTKYSSFYVWMFIFQLNPNLEQLAINHEDAFIILRCYYLLVITKIYSLINWNFFDCNEDILIYPSLTGFKSFWEKRFLLKYFDRLTCKWGGI